MSVFKVFFKSLRLNVVLDVSVFSQDDFLASMLMLHELRKPKELSSS